MKFKQNYFMTLMICCLSEQISTQFSWYFSWIINLTSTSYRQKTAQSKWWQFWKIHHFLQNIARYIAASLKDKISDENPKSQFSEIGVQNNTPCKMSLPDYAKLLIAYFCSLTKTIICHQLLHLMECIFRQHFQANFLHGPPQMECALLFQIRMS